MNYMKTSVWLGLVVTGLLSFSCANNPEKKRVSEEGALTYTNPLPVQFGDPYILLASDSMYYMYGTGGGAKDGFCAYSSSDLVNWKSEGQVFQGNIPGVLCPNPCLYLRFSEKHGRNGRTGADCLHQAVGQTGNAPSCPAV